MKEEQKNEGIVELKTKGEKAFILSLIKVYVKTLLD